jgi:hypothetical protein
MSLADQLSQALGSGSSQEDPKQGGRPGRGEKVSLGVGQHVEIRTKAGELVAVGDVQELAPETRTVTIMDRSSGADLSIEVDPSVYDIWVKEYEVPGGAPTPAKKPKLNANPRQPGAHTGGRF